MTDIQFGRLVDLPLRDAWKHEALQFTPWLAANIDHLSDAVGIPLELTGTEVAVESFSADILARNTLDDSVVLIENQLETTDHTHLGQIMTYLAGLEARTVVWIAPAFREPHLSAIRWLNEHTADGFSFFAVKARVVRIGDSPFAPIFEIVEKPNQFERSVQRKAEPVKSELSQARADFWHGLGAAHPNMLDLEFRPSASSNVWIKTDLPNTVVGLYIASNTCGIYVRSDASAAGLDIGPILAPDLPVLAERLNVGPDDVHKDTWFLVGEIETRWRDQNNWPEIWRWMAERTPLYLDALNDIAARRDQ